MSLSLVILAAGIGSRYGGLKQIDPVGEHAELIIDYSLYDALQAGFDRFVFVVRPEIEADVRAVIGARVESRADCVYVHQTLRTALPAGSRLPADRTKPLGTAHALLACSTVVNEPFAVINADDFYGADAFHRLAGFLAGQPVDTHDYAMVAYRLRNTLSEHGTVARGICEVTDDAWLRRVVEHTAIEATPQGARTRQADGTWNPLDADNPASMNCWGFSPSIFAYLERGFGDFLRQLESAPKAEYFLPTVIDHLIQRDHCRVRVLPTEAQWFGVTYPEDKPIVQARVRELVGAGRYPSPLWGD